MRMAKEGLDLLKTLEANGPEGDVEKATNHKSEIDQRLQVMSEQEKALVGKENRKARTELSKERSFLLNSLQYIDAVRVVKGHSPKHGFFLKEGQFMPAEKPGANNVQPPPGLLEEGADGKKTFSKKTVKPVKESAGLSPKEKEELENLKGGIVDLKLELKQSGLSASQINKHEDVIAKVERMNELKEKETPGSTAKKEDKTNEKKKRVLSAEQEAEVSKLQQDIETYRQMLQTEYKYSKKEIASDPDMVEKLATLAKLTGKK
ncbi:putative conserved tandem protein [Amphidinium carterae]